METVKSLPAEMKSLRLICCREELLLSPNGKSCCVGVSPDSLVSDPLKSVVHAYTSLLLMSNSPGATRHITYTCTQIWHPASSVSLAATNSKLNFIQANKLLSQFFSFLAFTHVVPRVSLLSYRKKGFCWCFNVALLHPKKIAFSVISPVPRS